MRRTRVAMERETTRRSRNALVLVAAGSSLIVGLVLLIDREPGRADVTAAAEATADELEATPVHGLGITIFDVDDAMSRATRGTNDRFHPTLASRLRVASAGENAHGDLYEITTSRGHHPVCLMVTVDDDPEDGHPSFPTTEVADGHCRRG